MIVRNKLRLGILCGLLMVSPIAWARPRGGGLSWTGPAGAGGSVPWNIVVLLSLLTLLPAILLSMTPFVRLLVVFHFLRQALGTQSTPSNQTLIGLALILTYFLMQPVGNAINSAAVVPFERGSVTALQAVEIGAGPLRHFMIKYSSAQVDKRRIGQLAMAIQGAFQDLGVFQGAPIRGLSHQPSLTKATIANKESMASRVFSASAPSDASVSDDEAVTQLRQELTEALSAEISEQKIALRHEPNGLVISLREVGFFDSGSAHIKPESLAAFDRIAMILRDKKYPLRIEGHTDDVPIHTSQFASNWELSAARATELVRTLIVRNGFPANRLSAGGFAEFHPVATNQTAEGRAQNRRVDVVILEQSPNNTLRPAQTVHG